VPNFAEHIKTALRENDDFDNVEAVKILAPMPDLFRGPDKRNTETLLSYIGQKITLDLALVLLNYEYDNGYGTQDCHNIYIWTKDKVYFIHEYDGATWLGYVDRNP
jgi:hypothetical protein